MRVGIMQPYFFPYVGYFQLIAAVDKFIVYDNIKYTKKGWINRNRMLLNGSDVMFSLPLKNDSDALNICEREISSNFDSNNILNQFRGAYQQAPYFKPTFLLLEEIIRNKEINLFKYLYSSIVKTCEYLGIQTRILVSSEIEINHDLKGQDKVLALCEAVGASSYLNAFGGINLYEKEVFQRKDIDLRFIKSLQFEYPQLGNSFIPWLSIIDVLMFNELDGIASVVSGGYEFL